MYFIDLFNLLSVYCCNDGLGLIPTPSGLDTDHVISTWRTPEGNKTVFIGLLI